MIAVQFTHLVVLPSAGVGQVDVALSDLLCLWLRGEPPLPAVLPELSCERAAVCVLECVLCVCDLLRRARRPPLGALDASSLFDAAAIPRSTALWLMPRSARIWVPISVFLAY